ncbi:MAG: hypothetical protein ABIO81_10355 [Ginsengibacter sp.]
MEVVSYNNNYKQIYWEEEGKEFSFKGEMYDVVKIKIINDEVVLYCIHDKKEKMLIDNYNLITKNNSSSEKKRKDNIGNAINLFINKEEKNNAVNFPLGAGSFYSYDSPLPESFIYIVSPPPKG